MKLTPEELAEAKAQIERMKATKSGAMLSGLSPEDAALAKKYPRHTLEQAREIEATPRAPMIGISSGFEFLEWQERGCNFSNDSYPED